MRCTCTLMVVWGNSTAQPWPVEVIDLGSGRYLVTIRVGWC